MDDQSPHSYQVNQDNKEFIITTIIINNNLKIECQDNNVAEFPVYSNSYTLNDLKEYNNFFSSMLSIIQAQTSLNAAIENQKVSIFPKNPNLISITFFLKDLSNKSTAITLQLEREKVKTVITENTIQPDNNSVEYSKPLDNERIDKLEEDSNKLMSDQNYLKNELNQIINRIDDLTNTINKLKDINSQLNNQTSNLKEENNARRDEAMKLRENNEKLKRQIKQMKEQKAKLEFLVGEHHDPDENVFMARPSKVPFSRISNVQNNNINNNNQFSRGSSVQPTINNNLNNNNRNMVPSNSVMNNIINQNELNFLLKKINKYNQKISFNLIYKASVDSDKAIAFHNNCDKALSSIVVIESNKGKRFGGFTKCSWQGDCIGKKDNDAFVFSLDKMKCYDIIPGKDAIGCYPDFGPVFFGCQIRVYDNAFVQGGTTFEKGVNYKTNEDYELTGGDKAFGIREIEVYEVMYN